MHPMGIGVIGSTEIGRGVRQGSRMSHILFNLYGEYLMKEALTEVGDFKIRVGLLIRSDLRMIRLLQLKLKKSYKIW